MDLCNGHEVILHNLQIVLVLVRARHQQMLVLGLLLLQLHKALVKGEVANHAIPFKANLSQRVHLVRREWIPAFVAVVPGAGHLDVYAKISKLFEALSDKQMPITFLEDLQGLETL